MSSVAQKKCPVAHLESSGTHFPWPEGRARRSTQRIPVVKPPQRMGGGSTSCPLPEKSAFEAGAETPKLPSGFTT